MFPRRHPRSELLSRYVDGDLDARRRRRLETHLLDCARCRGNLASLESAIRALGSLDADSPPGLADSIIAALGTEDVPQVAIGRRTPDATGAPALTVLPGSGQPSGGGSALHRWPPEALAALRWCLRRPQLRLTLPITVVAGVVLSLVNMGGMLLHGRIDLGVCVSCTIDFLVPFLTVNLGLLMLLRLPARRRSMSPPAPPARAR